MSILKVQKIRHTASDTDVIDIANDGTCRANIVNNLSNRNKIINGAMAVHQRSSSVTGISNANGYNTADRWSLAMSSGGGTWTNTISTDTPDGFASSYKLDCTTANGSLAAGDNLIFRQILEGQDLQDFAKGTSSAKGFIVSFYLKTNKTGTYVVEVYDNNNSRHVNKSYTVSNTNWNRYTLSFPADTTGAFTNNNLGALFVQWWLAAGTTFTSGTLQTSWGSQVNQNRASTLNVNLADNTSNEWYITGVQLEVDHTGSGVATDFEHRSFAEELALCQRYYQRIPFKDGSTAYHFIASGMASGTTAALFTVPFKTTMRANPSLGHSGSFRVYNGGGVAVTGLSTNASSVDVYSLQVSVSSGLSSTQGVLFGTNNDVDAHLQFISEL